LCTSGKNLPQNPCFPTSIHNATFHIDGAKLSKPPIFLFTYIHLVYIDFNSVVHRQPKIVYFSYYTSHDQLHDKPTCLTLFTYLQKPQ